MPTPNSPTVCAVIVTYNRLALLQKCLAGVRCQSRPVDHILVVNNGSTDGTAEWLASESALEFVTQGNTGGCGGFVTGIGEAEKRGFDWIWCMDDDVMPHKTALETQMRFAEPANVVICHKARDGVLIPLSNHLCEKTGRKIDISTPAGEAMEVNFGHFEGMLVPRAIVQKMGLPDSRTFIWGEDILYGYEASRLTKVILPREPLFEKLVPEVKTKVSNVSLYFDTRNHFILFEALHRAGTLTPMAYVYVAARMVRHAIWVLQEKQHVAMRLRLLAFGLIDALRGRWGVGSFRDLTTAK